jgi:hypothetical protein
MHLFQQPLASISLGELQHGFGECVGGGHHGISAKAMEATDIAIGRKMGG